MTIWTCDWHVTWRAVWRDAPAAVGADALSGLRVPALSRIVRHPAGAAEHCLVWGTAPPGTGCGILGANTQREAEMSDSVQLPDRDSNVVPIFRFLGPRCICALGFQETLWVLAVNFLFCFS